MKKRMLAIVNQSFEFDIKLSHADLESVAVLPVIRPHEHNTFHYVLDGELDLTIKNKTYTVQKGNIFLIPQQEPFVRKQNPTSPSKYLYVSFTGPSAKTLMSRAGLSASSPVLSVVPPNIEKRMRTTLRLMSQNTYTSIAKATVEFLSILCDLFELQAENNIPLVKPTSIKVVQIQQYIKDNYSRNLTVEEISEHFHFSRSYLTRIFKKSCGVSIKEYLNNYRIDQAVILIKGKSLSMNEIAQKTGFSDYATFYRMFKKKTGKIPLFYMQNYPLHK